MEDATRFLYEMAARHANTLVNVSKTGRGLGGPMQQVRTKHGEYEVYWRFWADGGRGWLRIKQNDQVVGSLDFSVLVKHKSGKTTWEFADAFWKVKPTKIVRAIVLLSV